MDISPSFIALLENLSISNSLMDDLNVLKIKVNSMDIEKLSGNINPELFAMLFQCFITDNRLVNMQVILN